MTLLKKIAATAIGLTMMGSAAQAGGISIDGIGLSGGDGFATGTFLTDPANANGFLSLGLGSYVDGSGVVDVIRDGDLNPVWDNGSSDRTLTWALDGAGLQVVDMDVLSAQILVIYLGTGSITYTSDANGGGDANTWLTADLASVGLTPYTNSEYAIMALVVHNGATVIGISEAGSMYYDVTGGLAAWALDTNSFANGHDLDGTFSTTLPNGSVRGTSSTNFKVPEPATLGLLGAGLLGLGLARRRKAAK